MANITCHCIIESYFYKMKKLALCILSTFFLINLKAQSVTAKVVDSATLTPLTFASIIFNNKTDVVYSDENGIFSLNKDSLQKGDRLYIQYLGYSDLMLPAEDLKNNTMLEMQSNQENLAPVVVSGCKKFRTYVINKRGGRIHHYIGPGPETKFVIIAKYNNRTGRGGYVNKVSVYIDEISSKIKIPIRFHWYEWDDETETPGEELTDKNIIVYPYKDGWNDFDIAINNPLPGPIYCIRS